MPNFTQHKSSAEETISIKVYGFEVKGRAKQVALLLAVNNFFPDTIHTIGNASRLLCCVDTARSINIYVRVIKWSPKYPTIEWTTDHTLFSRNLRSKARRSLEEFVSTPGYKPKLVKISMKDVTDMCATLGVPAS